MEVWGDKVRRGGEERRGERRGESEWRCVQFFCFLRGHGRAQGAPPRGRRWGGVSPLSRRARGGPGPPTPAGPVAHGRPAAPPAPAHGGWRAGPRVGEAGQLERARGRGGGGAQSAPDTSPRRQKDAPPPAPALVRGPAAPAPAPALGPVRAGACQTRPGPRKRGFPAGDGAARRPPCVPLPPPIEFFFSFFVSFFVVERERKVSAPRHTRTWCTNRSSPPPSGEMKPN